MESRAADWQGLAFALSPEIYATKSGVKPDLT
jgi:cardiolipin synthase